MRMLKRLLGLLLVAAVIASGVFAWFVLWPVNTIPPVEPVNSYAWLDQGLGCDGQATAQRDRYYYTAQGTSMPQGASAGAMRYRWFVSLELPFSKQRFADPSTCGSTASSSIRNRPPQTPIICRSAHAPISIRRIGEDVLDVTCAACHTGEIHRTQDGKTTAIRIDGGQAMHAFTDMSRGSFAPVLLASLIDTAVKPWKFDPLPRRTCWATAIPNPSRS